MGFGKKSFEMTFVINMYQDASENDDFEQYFLKHYSKFKVDLAFISKSNSGFFNAQSCDGWAAAWIINFIFEFKERHHMKFIHIFQVITV